MHGIFLPKKFHSVQVGNPPNTCSQQNISQKQPQLAQYLPSEVAAIFYPKPVKRSSLVGECAERIVDIWQSDLECVSETEAS